ncbi:MAG: hypothetical protein ABTQ27_03925 [Amaricoccus sp.]|uniref:hypothetical protein n=1 Tax=Amaricoccus sp. TaxID=1872485 RepID=UPI003315B678
MPFFDMGRAVARPGEPGGGAEEPAPDSTAAAMLFEHVWATRFASAVRAANGTPPLSGRIPRQVIAEPERGLWDSRDSPDGGRRGA